MSERMHVNCFLVEEARAQDFRTFIAKYNEPASYEEWQQQGFELLPPAVDILYEEASGGIVAFDLWFATLQIAFYVGLEWGRTLLATDQATHPAAKQEPPE